MSWSVVPFGRYSGKTLPEIIVRDLDWFFWVLPKLYGRLGTEARDLARKARVIKIPKAHRRGCEVEYRYDVDNRFCGFALSKLRFGIRDGHSDFRTSTLRGRFVAKSITSEWAGS
jgi:hypothetical protein